MKTKMKNCKDKKVDCSMKLQTTEQPQKPPPPTLPPTPHPTGQYNSTTKHQLSTRTDEETAMRTTSPSIVSTVMAGASKTTTIKPPRNDTRQIPPSSNTDGLTGSGLSIELIIVSAVAGLLFFVAVVALIVAYRSRRRDGDDEKKSKTNDMKTGVYMSIGELTGNSVRDSTADNPTYTGLYAEIGDHTPSPIKLPNLPPSSGIMHGKQRSGSASTLPLLSRLDFREGLSSPPPLPEVYDEPDLLVVSRAKTLGHVRYQPGSRVRDSCGSYLEPTIDGDSSVCQTNQGEHAYLELLPDENPITKDASDYKVPRTVSFKTHSVENLSSRTPTDKNDYTPSPGDQKQDIDVECDHKKASEACGQIPTPTNSVENELNRQKPTAPPLYFTLENKGNTTDSGIEHQSETRVYFTLDKESSNQKPDTIRDLHPKPVLKINTGKQEPLRDDASVNYKATSQGKPLYIEAIQETDDTPMEDTYTPGSQRQNEDPGYQQLPLTPLTPEDSGMYQRLNRGFMEQTLKR